jgi:hypothetical protein
MPDELQSTEVQPQVVLAVDSPIDAHLDQTKSHSTRTIVALCLENPWSATYPWSWQK